MERGRLYRIGDDLDSHVWYLDLLADTVAEVDRYLVRWTAFHEVVDRFADPDDEA